MEDDVKSNEKESEGKVPIIKGERIYNWVSINQSFAFNFIDFVYQNEMLLLKY
jgi:hypothetical protein